MARLAPARWPRIAALLVGGLFLVRVAAAAPPDPPRPPIPLPPGSVPVDAAVPATTHGPNLSRLTIASETTCPSESAVVQALATLCPPAEWPSGLVRIQAGADTLFVELISDGSTLRQLRVTDDCALRATSVALVIATWTGELASDAAGAPVLRSLPAGARGEVPKPVPPVGASALPVVAATIERELGAGLLLSLSGGVAPGVRIDFVQTRAPSGLGWQAGLMLPARRERATAGASTSWTRATASIAFNGRITLRRFSVSIDAGLAGAYTLTSGHGYDVAQGAQAFTGGLVVGTRLAMPWRRMRIWTDVRACKWFFPQTVAVDSAAGDRVATVALPSSDFQWALGLAYLFR